MKTNFRGSRDGLLSGYCLGIFLGVALLALPAVTQAIEYSVCKLPASCTYTSPEAAVNDPSVTDGDTINIVTDTYVLTATLQVDNNITIQANDSILDANGARAISVSAGARLIVFSATIQNGQAGPGFGGGALWASGGSWVTINNSHFENNRADFGGAIFNDGSTVEINSGVLTGNRATDGQGGAVLTVNNGTTTLARTEIDGNWASLAGGGVAVTGPDSGINLIRSTISNNIALDPVQTIANIEIGATTVVCGGSGITGQTFEADAGALSAFEFDIRLNVAAGSDPLATTVIPNDVFIAGRVREGGPAGPVIATAMAFAPGGVWPGTSNQTLTYILDKAVALIPGDIYAIETSIEGAYSIYASSQAVDNYVDGGQFCDGSLFPNFDYTFRTFGGAPGDGSGVYVSDAGFAGLFNSTVSGNVGDGAFAENDGFIGMEFSTVANNSVNGLVAFPVSPLTAVPAGSITFSSSIVANNGELDCSGSDFTSNGYNLVGTNSNCVFSSSIGDQIGSDLEPIDPLLGPLQDNGGLTLTHAIDETSPAIDSAGLAGALPCTSAVEDQRDITRPGGPACDIGAYEFIPSSDVLQGLIDALPAGSVISVPNGIYTESISIGDGKILRGSGPGNVVIDATGFGESAITVTGDFTLEGIRVTGGNSSGDGGAIVANVAGTDIILINVLVDNNSASDDGGGIYLPDGTLSVSDSTFLNNSAGQNGGAVFSGGSATIIDTTINLNDANVGGGFFNGGTAALLVSRSTFAENIARLNNDVAGGAIGGAGSMDIRNSTFSGNTAQNGHGGGIGLSGGSATLNNVTLAFNSAAGLGGAFYADSGTLLTFGNSLVSENTGGITNCNVLISKGYNLFQNNPCPTINGTDIVADPLINGLADNGGATETHSLQSLSPAINAAHPVARFPQFNTTNIALFQTRGFTTADSGSLLLAAGTFNVGSAFVPRPIDPNNSFSASFQFQMVPDAGGAADGFTFTLSDDPTVLGSAGGFLGIGMRDPIEPSPAVRGVVNGVSVEFDTWDNGQAEGANDPSGQDHIGIDFNGSLSSDVLTSLGPHGTLSDGNIWTAWIDYDAGLNVLEVRATNSGVRPSAPMLSGSVDLATLTGPLAYVGFTGATGSSGISAEQRILNFSFAASCESGDQRDDTRPKGAACDIGAFETAATPAALGQAMLSTETIGQAELDDGTSYPGVVTVPIIDIPIEKLTGDGFNSPASAPLGSFPLGSFPLGSFDLRTSPLGSFPLGSFPLGSFPLGSFPLGSFPLGSFPLSAMPLLSVGGWREVLSTIPELDGAPLQTVTLEQLLAIDPLPAAVASIELRDLNIDGSPLASLSLPGLSLGNTTVEVLDAWGANSGLSGVEPICDTLAKTDSSLLGCSNDDTYLSLEMQGAPVSALSLSAFPLGSFPLGSFPLGSFPLGSFPLGSFPLGSFPLGSFPLGSFPLGSFPLGSFPLGSFPLGSFPLGSFPLGSFDLLATPLGSFPLGSFPLGSFPLGSFEIDGKSFCQYYDEQARDFGSSSCAVLDVDPVTDSLPDLVEALQREALEKNDTTSSINSSPLGSFPLGSFDISNLPLGSFSLEALSQPPISEVTLGFVDVDGSNGCELIADNSSDSCSSLGLNDNSTLLDLANAYGGSLASSPLGSFPLGSFGVAELPLGSFPLGSFEINGVPLGSFPLGSFDLITSPLGSFPLGSFSSSNVIIDTSLPCEDCETLADAALAGVILSSATLEDLRASTEFAETTLGVVLNAMTLAMLHGTGTLGDIRDTGNLTLGQLLIAMMLKTDFPWETIPLEQLDAQEFAADHFVAYVVDFELSGSEAEQVNVEVTIADEFLYVQDSTSVVIETPLAVIPAEIEDPFIADNPDGTQTLRFNANLGGFGFTSNSLRFEVVTPTTLGDYSASATVQIGGDTPVDANAIGSLVSIIDPDTVSIIDPDTGMFDPQSVPTSPADVLVLGFINEPDDKDFYKVAATAKGERVAVFMANPSSDNDLIMYQPLSTVEAKGQTTESPALDSVPFEDDGISYEGNITEESNALEDVNLRAAPLASVSTNRKENDEAVYAIAGDDAPFVIQVSGYNGAVSDDPYTLRVKLTPKVPTPECTDRSWPFDASSTAFEPQGEWLPDTNSVFLVNWARLAASDPDGEAGADDALNAINDLLDAPGITNGVVVDVSTIFGVNYGPWDENPCDVDAANNIVNAITLYLEEQRVVSPGLTYVTIVGSDEIIPFARKPDETSISNESTFANEFSDNAMYGALVTRHILSDDTYGDIDPIPWLGRYLNVPELGVGRLVESAEDIQLAAENYIDFSGMLDPRTAVSAGYDFISDAAQAIDDTFDRYSAAFGYDVISPLIDQPDVDPMVAWTREDFLDASISNKPKPVELVAFNMHFNFSEALPSSGDASGNYIDNLFTTADLGSTDLGGGIWFTVGCHSGTNLADISVVGDAPTDDWAQSFSHLGAVYLAQTGYGLGDTVAIALSERLLTLFTRNLDGRMTVGLAHAQAKQQYFADLGLYGEYDYKVLQTATLFGLPMYQYGDGSKVKRPELDPLAFSIDPVSGLGSVLWSNAEYIIDQDETPKGDLFSVDGDVQFVHYRPLQPIVRRDVTGPEAEIAAGAFLTELVTEDLFVEDIAYARPVIADESLEPEIETDEIIFPTVFTNITSYKAPPPEGGLFEPHQQLNVIVGQFTSLLDGQTSGNERLFRSFSARVFYRAKLSPAKEDYIRPEFDNVEANLIGSPGSEQVTFSVDVFDEGTVARVAVLYLQSVSSDPPQQGQWVLSDLVQGADDNWSGGGSVDPSGIIDGKVDYMVQAVDSNANVANSTFKGVFYQAVEPPTFPPSGGPIDVVIKVNDAEVDPDTWITGEPVEVQVDHDPDVSYEYSVDSAAFTLLTSAGFQISGDGLHFVTVRESDGSNPISFVILIDTSPPLALITTPADGDFIVQGQQTPADYYCSDAGSGVSSCIGSVADGVPVPSAAIGVQSFTVTAQDFAHQNVEPPNVVMEETNYYVVQPLQINGPVEPTVLGNTVTITASATNLVDIEESASIDWGDGSSIQMVDLTATGVGDMSGSHTYAAPDIYQITVSVDYQGQFTQVATFDSVAVFEATGGFVSGAGWIESPPSAYTPDDPDDPLVTGRAHFNFKAKYSKGRSEPEGTTSFSFTAGGLEFDSTSYDWLIISESRSRFIGEGIVKGDPVPYKFMVTVLDADSEDSATGLDGFRIKVWQKTVDGTDFVIYDNGLGTPADSGDGGTTALGGGSVIIHLSGKASKGNK